MSKAMGYWSRSTNINFKETASSKPDIWVKFTRYHHGDPYSFDGRGGTLAHAFYPHNNQGWSGDIHFDDDENYTYQSSRGRNLLWVATHELGRIYSFIYLFKIYIQDKVFQFYKTFY